MARDPNQRVGDTGFLVRTKGMLDRAGLKKREVFLENLGRIVSEFRTQIGATSLSWEELKEKLGEEGWRTSILFTGHMAKTLEDNGDEFGATPWKLITVSLCPAQRATDASPDQMKWLDQLIAEAERHCARVGRTRKAG